MSWRGVGNCNGCHREGIEVESRSSHGERLLCDKCAAVPPRKPRAVASDFEPQPSQSSRADIAVASVITRMADVQSRSIRWAWTGRLPVGYPVVQAGDEGVGKSVFSAWMIARLTLGELDGDWRGQPMAALIVADEDGIEDTWKPRLDLAGADMTRVAALRTDSMSSSWNIRDGISEIARGLRESDARVLFVDALLDHMPPPKGGESINSPTFVRAALKPLKRLMRERQAVCLFSMHPPKGRAAEYRNRVQGSQAFSAVPRIGLLFDHHPDDRELPEHDRRRVLLRGKGNIGRDPGALAFRVIGRPYEHGDGRTTDREVVVEVEPCDVTLVDLAPERVVGARNASKQDRAIEFLSDALAGGTWRPAKPLQQEMRREGVSEATLHVAARKLGVEKRKVPGVRDAGWEWRLPQIASAVPAVAEASGRVNGWDPDELQALVDSEAVA